MFAQRMETGVKFFIMAGVTVVTTIVGSLLWPRLTASKRPDVLTDVRNAVVATQWGSQTANILGVSDEEKVQPVSVASIASSLADTIKQGIQERTQTIVVHQALTQLEKQYSQLPPEQKKEIQEALCKPIEK